MGDMDALTNIGIAAVFMALLGTLLAWLLAVANRRLYVYEDPRINEVEELLPKSNCGACGTAGCRNFAEGLVEGKLQPVQCTVNSPDMNKYIAGFLGVSLGEQEKRVARLACAGGSHVAIMRAHYDGMESCRAAAIVGGGGKGCAWGCLGLGDCEVACDFDAIFMDRHGLPQVIADKCTACNDCVEVCPKGLFSLEPVSRKLWVVCKNQAEGDIAEADCEVACTACGRCVVDAAPGLIKLENNLAVIDYAKNELAARLAIERCPTGAIVWLDDAKGPVRGVAAKKILRQKPLPLASV
jgi:Na+-translocating ferredoxin:NAD+ oxidoreductase RNF subunit RnfB